MNGFWERIFLPFGVSFRSCSTLKFPATSHRSWSGRLSRFRKRLQWPRLLFPVSREVERAAPETFDRAVQMLALLQRDGRLIDFLAENISAYPDTQLGAAVRTIHETCRQVLDRYVKLEPIFDSEEDQPVTVQAGFDPAAIKLIGNVAGQPPVRGMLRHKGWRVKEVNLPPLPSAAGRMVIAPAEVELS